MIRYWALLLALTTSTLGSPVLTSRETFTSQNHEAANPSAFVSVANGTFYQNAKPTYLVSTTILLFGTHAGLLLDLLRGQVSMNYWYCFLHPSIRGVPSRADVHAFTGLH